jgi:hypothetical protein
LKSHGLYDNVVDFEINVNETLYNEYFGEGYQEHRSAIVHAYHAGNLNFDEEKEFIINHGPIGLALTYDLSDSQLSKILDAACLDKKYIFYLIEYKNIFNIRLDYLKNFVDKLADNIVYINALTYNNDLNDYIANKILSFSDDCIYNYICQWSITKEYTTLLLKHIDSFIIDLINKDTRSLYTIIDTLSDSLSNNVLSAILDIDNDIFFDMIDKTICYAELFPEELQEKFNTKMAPYFVLQQLKGDKI